MALRHEGVFATESRPRKRKDRRDDRQFDKGWRRGGGILRGYQMWHLACSRPSDATDFQPRQSTSAHLCSLPLQAAIMSGYDFSQLYHSSLVVYSPGTTFIATAHQNRIIVRSTTTLQIVRAWLCTPSTPIASSSKTSSEFHIDTLQWSDDGSYILAVAKSTVWIFALAEEGNGESGEVARVGEGLEGCVKAEWGKGSRDVIVWSDYGVSDFKDSCRPADYR